MKKFLTTLTILVFTFFLQGCNDDLQIQGSGHIYINEAQPYKLIALSEDIQTADSYKWKVKSKNKDYTLTNDQTSAVIFNAQSIGTYTLEVKVKKDHKTFKTELEIEVAEPEVINGYALPSEPDKTLNDSTLLGIDVNNNIIRDDVERWIYKTYNNPVEIGLFMQSARAYQLIIEDPSKAEETVVYSDNALACEFYYTHQNDVNILDKYKYFDNIKELKQKQFNTIERHMAHKRYNAAFNGKVLHAPEESKEKCEFDENGILGALK